MNLEGETPEIRDCTIESALRPIQALNCRASLVIAAHGTGALGSLCKALILYAKQGEMAASLQKAAEMSEEKRERPASHLKIAKKSTAQTAAEAYIFGYPLVLMDVTRQVATNFSRPNEDGAPVNQLCNKRSIPDTDFNKVVSPNADTLYSSGFLDLKREPIVLTVPETGARYYLMQMLDAWSNVFASVGTRTSGNSRDDFAIAGPLWQGELPEGVHEIHSPTNMVWIIGRTETSGKTDYAAVHAIQNRYHLNPLSAFGRLHKLPDEAPVDPQIDMKTAPVDQVSWLSAERFFSRLNALMEANPPAHQDLSAIRRFASLGVAPGKSFRLEELDHRMAAQVEQGVREARTRILAEALKPNGRNVRGWRMMTDLGRYGTRYLWRAVVAHGGLGANLPEDAIYAVASTDAEGKPLNGANAYKVHFEPGGLPPVGAFWSITMYNSRQFFVPNPIDRYAIGDRDPMHYEEDGSLMIYIQNEPPRTGELANWLPAPRERFNLMMRLYWPTESIIQGIWKPPGIERTVLRAKRIA